MNNKNNYKNGLPEKKLRSDFSSGFTLIELLVVIAIIGMLASTVLVSLGTARSKGRDAKRIADLKNIEMAIQLYSDANGGAVPNSLGLLVPKYLAKMPKDPNTGLWYGYAAFKKVGGSGSTKCIKYHLGATLENKTSVHDGDSDWSSGSADNDVIRQYNTICSSPANSGGLSSPDSDGVGNSGSGFNGTQEDGTGKCGQANGDSGYCFDLVN